MFRSSNTAFCQALQHRLLVYNLTLVALVCKGKAGMSSFFASSWWYFVGRNEDVKWFEDFTLSVIIFRKYFLFFSSFFFFFFPKVACFHSGVCGVNWRPFLLEFLTVIIITYYYYYYSLSSSLGSPIQTC